VITKYTRLATVALASSVALFTPASAAIVRTDVGFTSNTLAGNDDSSVGPVGIGFNVKFFGTTYSSLFVNNNGNVTFTDSLSTFSPFGLLSASIPIIAPFFADVDTRSSSPVTYGNSIINGRNAFGVNWLDVGGYGLTSERNSFQLVLMDRSDVQAGAFDMEFNYGSIEWDTGTFSSGNSARIGWSNGTDKSFELTGSGVAGAFLDDGQNALIFGAPVSFTIRDGAAPEITNRVPDGGSTAIFLGLSLQGLEGIRRRMMRA
jgi:hypothetical protein